MTRVIPHLGTPTNACFSLQTDLSIQEWWNPSKFYQKIAIPSILQLSLLGELSVAASHTCALLPTLIKQRAGVPNIGSTVV